MAKTAEKNKLSKRFKSEHLDLQISVKHHVVTALNLTEDLIKLLEDEGLGHYLEPNE